MEEGARKAIDDLHKELNKKRRLAPVAIVPSVTRRIIPVADEIHSIFWDSTLNEEAKRDIVRRFFPAEVGAQLVRSEPPIVYFESFLDKRTLDDVLRFIKEQWTRLPPERSAQETAEGVRLGKATAQRTSVSEGFDDIKYSIMKRIAEKAREKLGLPENAKYLEYLQVVRYTEGQKFDLHHDTGTLHVGDDGKTLSVEVAPDTLESPLRAFTIFVYLNDVPEVNGGATIFPLAKDKRSGEPLSVQPRAGAAAMWANVNEKGDAAELRTIHAAEPLRGKDAVKTGMNIWFTFREFSHNQPHK